MPKKPTPATTASVDAPQANAAPVAQQSTKYDEADHYNNAPRRYFASPEQERAYYIIKDQQETITASLGLDATYEAKVSGTRFAQSLSSTPQPVVAPVMASATPPQAPAPAVPNTLPTPTQTAHTPSPVVTLAWCNAWLQFTHAHELAELVKLGIYIQARAVCLPGRPGPDTAVLLTVKDGLLGGEVGADGQMTFTFLDGGHLSVKLGSLTMSRFQNMACRFWQDLPMVVSVYQARAEYIAATGASPAENMPDVEARVGYKEYNWFTGETLPKMDETQDHYSLSRLVALVDTYDQWADEGV